MRDLQSQLHRYVEDTIERVDVEDVVASASDQWSARESRRPAWQRAAAFAFGLVLVLVVIGGVAWLVRSGDESPAVEPTVVTSTTQPPDANVSTLSWHQVAGASEVETVRALVPGCCWNVVLGDDFWIKGFGESFTGPGSEPIPAEVGPLRSIAVNGVEELVAVPDVDLSADPYFVAQQIGGESVASGWTTETLPTDVPSPHPDVTMHYMVQSVVQSNPYFVLYGWALPELDWAAIEREYPELAPVVRTDLLPPCCEGVPPTTEIEDPLWVWTGSQSSDPTAISLATFGLTADDLRGTTGVVWVIARLSGPAPWEPKTALTIEGVGPEEAFLDGDAGVFTLVVSRATGDYETWTSVSGGTWSNEEAALDNVIDMTVWHSHPLVLTGEGAVLELRDGSWTTFKEAGTLDPPNGDPADPVRIEAGDAGVVVVSDREEILPWSEGEPIPTAQMLWFSADGSHWSSQEVSDLFGDVGAVDLLVTRYAGNREGPPSVLVAFGSSQDDGYPITDPQWWAAEID